MEKGDFEAAHDLAKENFGEHGDAVGSAFQYYFRNHAGRPDGVRRGKRLQYVVVEKQQPDASFNLVGFGGVYSIPTESRPVRTPNGQPLVFRAGYGAIDKKNAGLAFIHLVNALAQYSASQGASALSIETSNQLGSAYSVYTKLKKQGHFEQGYHDVKSYFPDGRPLLTAYKPIAPAGKPLRVQEGDFRLKRLNSRELSALSGDFRQLESLVSSPRRDDFKRVADLAASGGNDWMATTHFYGLVDRQNRVHAVADVTRHGWAPRVVFTSFLHARGTPSEQTQRKEALLRLLHHKLGQSNPPLHVVHAEKPEDLKILERQSFHTPEEPDHAIDDFYAPDYRGDLFVMKLDKK